MTNIKKHIEFSSKELAEGIETPFTVPVGYFETLLAKIEDNVSEEAPEIEGINNSSVFKVPEDYFDHLTIEIESKTSKKSNNTGFKKQINYLKLIAACVVLLIATGSIYYFSTTSNPTQTDKYVEDYFDYAEVDEFSLMEAIHQQELDIIEDSASIKQIENYLLNNSDYHQILLNL